MTVTEIKDLILKIRNERKLGGNTKKRVADTLDGMVDLYNEIETTPGPPGEQGIQGPVGEISILNFEIDEDMHLIMQIQTNSELNFSLDSNGHLILNN